LLMDRDKISNLHRGPAIDASHPVSVHLAKPLVGLCEHFSKLVKLGGQLVLSGIFPNHSQ
jgi:ribosomal protein L11 methylase PrmA